MKGTIKQRSEGSYFLIIDLPRERGEKRKQKWITYKGSARGAQKELARLITEMEGGEYVETSKLTLGLWVDQWIEAGAPGRRRKKVSQRTLERYSQLLRTLFDGSLGHAVEDIPPHARPLDAPLTADTMMFRFTHKMIVKALEDWTHVIPTPAGKTKLSPVIVISRLAAHGDHGIDCGGAAHHLAARILQRPAVKTRFLHCLEHPVRPRIADSEEIADRNVKPDPVVVATGFQYQNTVVTIGR